MRRYICILLLGLMPLFACVPAVQAGGSAHDFRDVPIVMYHSVLRDPARTGGYTVSPVRLAEDIVWLQEHGYTIVTAREVIDFGQGIGNLPEKPVLLTFDDGYYNNLTYVLPILQQYGCTAVLGVVGAYSQRFTDAPDPNPNYAYLSWDEVYALVLSGCFEIANHSYDMHGQTGRMGSARKAGESAEAYAAAFTADTKRLQSLLAARAYVTPALYAYPFGIADPESRALLLELGFSGSMTCRERISRVVSGAPETLWGLGRFNRTGELTTEAFMRRMGLT